MGLVEHLVSGPVVRFLLDLVEAGGGQVVAGAVFDAVGEAFLRIDVVFPDHCTDQFFDFRMGGDLLLERVETPLFPDDGTVIFGEFQIAVAGGERPEAEFARIVCEPPVELPGGAVKSPTGTPNGPAELRVLVEGIGDDDADPAGMPPHHAVERHAVVIVAEFVAEFVDVVAGKFEERTEAAGDHERGGFGTLPFNEIVRKGHAAWLLIHSGDGSGAEAGGFAVEFHGEFEFQFRPRIRLAVAAPRIARPPVEMVEPDGETLFLRLRPHPAVGGKVVIVEIAVVEVEGVFAPPRRSVRAVGQNQRR